MSTARIVFIGGFLGAGKTTLLSELTGRLMARGMKVGVITNDQAPDLVDTILLNTGSASVAEVTGSCFCCDFNALRRAIDKVGLNIKADIILAEPVGSCTDLSATIINPLKDKMQSELLVSPLTVLADPARLMTIFSESREEIHPSAAYIIKKQLEEGDIIAITKTDLYPEEEISRLKERLKADFPECEITAISSKTGEGVKEWLDSVLNRTDSGKHITDVDYDRYAEGEAVLGWLNSTVALSGKDADWDEFARRFMTIMASETGKRNLPVGHLKFIVENGDKYIAANLTGKSETLNFRWSAGKGDTARMTVNARVEMSPSELEKLFRDSLAGSTAGEISTKIISLKCISPGYPRPTYRYNA